MANLEWIKVNVGIFKNRKIIILLKERDGDTLFRVWIQLITLAGECNRNGALVMNDNTPMTVHDLSVITGKTEYKLTKIMQRFVDLEMLIIDENTYYIKNWDNYQSADKLNQIRESNRNRQRKFRAKNKVENNVTVTSSNAVDKSRLETELEQKRGVENESGFRD